MSCQPTLCHCIARLRVGESVGGNDIKQQIAPTESDVALELDHGQAATPNLIVADSNMSRGHLHGLGPDTASPWLSHAPNHLVE
jgi:hypothetical protein